jgi:hypothetical protein
MAQSLSLFTMMSLTISVVSQLQPMSLMSFLTPSKRSLCLSVHPKVSQNILKVCNFSFWMSLKLGNG